MNTEKPKTHLSILFTLTALSAFITGLLLGLFVPLNSNNKPQAEGVEPFNVYKPPIEQKKETIQNTVNQKESQKESLDRYKKMLEQTVQSELSNFPELKHYGIVVGSYAAIEQANGVSIDLKKQYPEWSISVYPLNQLYKVIIGSFTDQAAAQEFLSSLPKKSQFLKAQIIQIPRLK